MQKDEGWKLTVKFNKAKVEHHMPLLTSNLAIISPKYEEVTYRSLGESQEEHRINLWKVTVRRI